MPDDLTLLKPSPTHAPPAPAETLLKLGAQGPTVARLVDDLRAAGFRLPAGDAFDDTVRQTVRTFQVTALDASGHPLIVDGKVGPHTRWALEATLKGVPPSRNTLRLPPAICGGSATGRAALQVALEEMAAGAGETVADNQGPDIERYLRGATPRRWCAVFVSWCFLTARGGEEAVFGYRTRSTSLHKAMRRKGHAYAATLSDPPQPGDIIVWRRLDPQDPEASPWRGHCGIVYGFEAGNLWTVEGNRGSFPSKVRAFRYSWVDLVASATEDEFRGLYGLSRHP